MALALDISHFTNSTSGPLTTKQLEDAWNNGVRAFRPSIAVQEVAVQQIDTIVDSHIPFDIWTYRYYYFGRGLAQIEDDKAFIQRVRELKYNIQLHSIDIEDTTQGFTVAQRINEAHQWISAFANFCNTDMYSAYWYWTQYMGNTDEFNYMPWWVAEWYNDPSYNPSLGLNYPFGGIDTCHMKQYRGDVDFAGIWCDINYYEPAIVPPQPIYVPITSYDYRGAESNKHKYEEVFNWEQDAPPSGPGPRVDKSPLTWNPAGFWENTTRIYKHW